jgi:signal transduction histidine kinase
VREHSNPGQRAPQLRYPADLPEVPLDDRLVQRVLRNIIGNAYKHAGAQASVTLRAQSGQGYVFFAVEDNGPGIPPEEREQIFERFVQGSGARAGSGLGLAFCKLVVEQHGGQIWAEAVPSGGTRICFALPLDAEQAASRSAA